MVCSMQGRNQLMFSRKGQNDCILFLYLTIKHVFENFGGSVSPLVVGLVQRRRNQYGKIMSSLMQVTLSSGFF